MSEAEFMRASWAVFWIGGGLIYARHLEKRKKDLRFIDKIMINIQNFVVLALIAKVTFSEFYVPALNSFFKPFVFWAMLLFFFSVLGYLNIKRGYKIVADSMGHDNAVGYLMFIVLVAFAIYKLELF